MSRGVVVVKKKIVRLSEREFSLQKLARNTHSGGGSLHRSDNITIYTHTKKRPSWIQRTSMEGYVWAMSV